MQDMSPEPKPEPEAPSTEPTPETPAEVWPKRLTLKQFVANAASEEDILGFFGDLVNSLVSQLGMVVEYEAIDILQEQNGNVQVVPRAKIMVVKGPRPAEAEAKTPGGLILPHQRPN